MAGYTNHLPSLLEMHHLNARQVHSVLLGRISYTTVYRYCKGITKQPTMPRVALILEALHLLTGDAGITMSDAFSPVK